MRLIVILIEMFLFMLPWLIVAGAAFVVIKEMFLPLIRGQYMFPHYRDPIVMALDKIERDRQEARVRSERAQADFDIALSDIATRKRETLTNLQIQRIHSGEIEDEVTRLLNEKASKLEAMAKDIRAGNVDLDKINVDDIVDPGPVPDLGDGHEKERGNSREKIR